MKVYYLHKKIGYTNNTKGNEMCVCCIGNTNFFQYNFPSDFLGLNLLKYLLSGLVLCSLVSLKGFVRKSGFQSSCWQHAGSSYKCTIEHPQGVKALTPTYFESAHN